MDKKEYIKQEIFKLVHYWANLSLSIGAIIVLLLSFLDVFVTPENFSKFLIYRLGCAVILFILIFLNILNKNKQNENLQLSIFILATITVSSMVELMILSFGGHQSIYYAGIIVIFITYLGFVPLISLKKTIFFASLTYAIYLLPILIFDNITNIRVFINNNIFLLSAASIAILWRYYNDKLLIKKLSLEYDLSKDKEQLETYSTQLEELVQERTKELTISEQRFRALFDNANDGVVVLDKNGIIINMNNKFCELHGFDKEALIGTHFRLLEVEDNKDEKEGRLRRILNGEPLVFETEHYKRDGSRILLEVSSKGINIGGDLYIQSFHRDITEKKAIQEQLIQSQKMESIGALAGGIAHNFNNLLTAILGYSELLQENDLDDDSKQKAYSIESSARKAGVLVSKLLSFSRKERFEILPLNLTDIINDSVKLLEGVLDKRVGLKTKLNKNIPAVEGDPNQLEQVIMNLIVNAKDAMPDGGLITITTSVIEVRKGTLDIPAYIMPGRYVLLTVSDTGCGIPKDIINRIFEPFFTTKEKGKGTGLGLASVYGIIKDHKGYITVQSEIDKGSVFDVYLAISDKTIYTTIKPKLFSVEGHENILLVDDEEDVLNFIKDTLESHGYKVIPARNPLAAVDIFKKLSGDIHLVMTDIVMPLMEGKELIKKLRTIKPDIKIIAISGYSDEVITKDNMIIDEFIRKPFEVYQMLSTVRRVLDKGIRNLPLY